MYKRTNKKGIFLYKQIQHNKYERKLHFLNNCTRLALKYHIYVKKRYKKNQNKTKQGQRGRRRKKVSCMIGSICSIGA